MGAEFLVPNKYYQIAGLRPTPTGMPVHG
jgi:hypothetical protein